MDLRRLTADLVEKLQRSQAKGKDVSKIIGGLQSATLAGLVEYGCLRFTFPQQFSQLPELILNSELGRALANVRCPLGAGADGPAPGPVKSIQPRPVEFFALVSELETDSTEWNNFCHRFESGVKQAGFGSRTALHLHFALHEMATNATIHSNSPAGTLVGYEVEAGSAAFSVVDVGDGVLASLRSSPRFERIARDVDAIQKALRPGVSRLGRGGTGFAQVFKAVAEDWGELRFRSRNGCVSMNGRGLNHEDDVKRSWPPVIPGFQVSMSCRSPIRDDNSTVF